MKSLFFIIVFAVVLGLGFAFVLPAGKIKTTKTFMPDNIIGPMPENSANNKTGLRTYFAPSNLYYNFAADSGFIYVYTEFRAPLYRGADTAKRTPLNISLVIDKSGSMQGEKLENAKKAALFVVDHVTPDDYISVVMYDSEVKTLFPSQKVKDKTMLKNLISSIRSGSTTNLSGGMLEGYTQVESTYKSGFVNRVLLMSDGLANVGVTDNTSLFEIARNKLRQQGISISTFGVGLDYNEDLMQGLAENGNGNYYFIANPEDIHAIFKKELSGLLNLYAQNTKIMISFPESLKLQKVYGMNTENSSQNQVVINLRDVFSEETKACMLKFSYNNNELRNELPFAAEFTWNDMSKAAQNKSEKQDFLLTYQKDTTLMAQTENKEVLQQVVLFESNELLQQTMQMVDKRDFEGAKRISAENMRYMEKAKTKVVLSKDLLKQDSVNINYDKKIEQSKNMRDNELKMYQKSSKESNYKMKYKK